MFGRFVSGFKQALQVQSEPPTPMPGSPIPGAGRLSTTDSRDRQSGQRFGSLSHLDRSPSPTSDIVMEGLSEAEKFHILNVMARAESNADVGPVVMDPMAPEGREPLSRASSISDRRESMQRMLETEPSHSALFPTPKSTSVADIPLDGLTEEERSHILSVMARAESNADIAHKPDNAPGSKIDSAPIAVSAEPARREETADPSLASQLENSGLEDWELEQIMDVMKKAKRESDAREPFPLAPDYEASLETVSVPAQQEYSQWKYEEGEKHQLNLTNIEHDSSEEKERVNEDEPGPAVTDIGGSRKAMDESEDESSVQSSEETEGADEVSSVEDGSGYSSPAAATVQRSLPGAEGPFQPIDQFERPSDDIRKTDSTPAPIGLDDPALAGLLPEGIELLSAEEQAQIISVLKRAVIDSGGDAEGRTTTADITDEWRHQEPRPPDNDSAMNNEFDAPLQQSGSVDERNVGEELWPIETETDRGAYTWNMQREEEDYAAVKRRVPDLKFEISEEINCNEEIEEAKENEHWKANYLGGASPVAITIQPPSPCPTDSGSDDEDYWTRAQRAQQSNRQDETEGEYDQEQVDFDFRKDDWAKRDYEDEGDQEGRVEDSALEEQEGEAELVGDMENMQRSESAEENQPVGDFEGEEFDMVGEIGADEAQEIYTTKEMIIDDREEPEYMYFEEKGEEERHDLDEEAEIAEATVSPTSDRQIEEAGDEDAANEADNEGERYDRFDTDAPESSFYDETGASGTAYYGGMEYYVDEYQHSESGSSSGYGSRGVLGLSSYASGEGLSQQGAGSGLLAANGQGIGTHGIAYSALNRGGSLQDHLAEDTQTADEIADTRKIIDQLKFEDHMTKSAPAEGDIYYHEYEDSAEKQLGKMEPAADRFQKADLWRPSPMQSEEIIQSRTYQDFDIRYSYPLTLAEQREAVPCPLPAKEIPSVDEHYSDEFTDEEVTSSFGHVSKAFPVPPVSTSGQEHPPAWAYGAPDQQFSQQAPSTPSAKSPERSSFFSSLKQAAMSPAPKSSFGSFFSGASQALKSQTGAVLKKAVDTVSQVAAAGDISPKHGASAATAPASAIAAPVSVQPAPIEAVIDHEEPPPAKAGSMETLLGDYDYDSQYSLKKLIKHEQIVPVKQEIIVQKVQQPVYEYEWSVEQQSAMPQEPKIIEPVLPPAVAAPSASTVIEVPGMPDLDLSQFNEEERSHLLAMIGKAKEMEEELHSVPSSAAPSRSASFSHHEPVAPVTTVVEEPDEDTLLLLESYKAATESFTATAQATRDFGGASLAPHNLPWSVPSIREIGATPECQVDVEEAFAAATATDTPTLLDSSATQQQYDSSEVSSTMCDDDDQQERMTEIEADLRGDAVHTGRVKSESSALAECPLCKRMVLRCWQGSYGATGQMCADCGVVVCAECGHVVPRYMGKVWLCSQCHLEEQANMDRQQDQQWDDQPVMHKLDDNVTPAGSAPHRPAAPKSAAARRRRRRTTAIGQRRQTYEDEDEEDGHFRPPAALSQDQPKGVIRSMGRPPDGNDSDESDEEAEARRYADDDDYPDEVIEVPPAPLSPDAQTGMPITSMDNGNADGTGGLGADVLAAIASTFSSSSSECTAFNDALVDSSPEKRTKLQQEIAYSSVYSLTQAAPPPVPARTHRIAPPPPSTTTPVPQQRQAANVFTCTTAPADGYHSGAITDSSQFPQQKIVKEAQSGSVTAGGQYFDSSTVSSAMSWESVQQKHSFEETTASDKTSDTGCVIDMLRQEEGHARVAAMLIESEEREEIEADMRSRTMGYGGSEDEQAATTGDSEEEEEEEQIDYAQAMKYYNNNPFFTHRPGPVYTIPEDEESDELPGEADDVGGQRHAGRAGVSPNYQQLLKQHQQQQQLRQQHQQKLQMQQEQLLLQQSVVVSASQPTASSTGSIYHKRNPFIDEEYDNEDTQQDARPLALSQPTQHARVPEGDATAFSAAKVAPAVAPATEVPPSREVTALVSSQQYFASQQQQRETEKQMPLIGSAARPLPAQAVDVSSCAGRVPFAHVSKASDGASRVNTVTEASSSAAGSIITLTQTSASLASILTTNYAPVPASLDDKENRRYEYGVTAKAGTNQQALKNDVETRYAKEEQVPSIAQRQQPLLNHKRETPASGALAIDYTSTAAETETGPVAVPGRPTLAFLDDDIPTGQYHVQQPSQQPFKEKPSSLANAAVSEGLLYSQGAATTIGQLVWQRDDQQHAAMTTAHGSTGSRSSEDEEALDADNQFVSKLKRSPAMILHADAEAAAAGRRPPAATAGQQQPQADYYEDVLTDEAPVAWPTFLGHKGPAPHQLPPFPPPPTAGVRQRFPANVAEDQPLVASSGGASAPSLTITGSGGASGRAPEMGRRKLPSIPAAASGGLSQSDTPYSVRGHYVSMPFDVEHQFIQQQHQEQHHAPVQHEPMLSSGQTWRTVTATGSTAAANTKDQRLRLVHATPSLRMPATLARVLLKQELREALNKRQQQLEASEIEANQRQYSVQRYLHTGVYPPSVGLQNTIPRTVQSSLPLELLAGCKIQFRPPSTIRAAVAVTSNYGAAKVDNVSYASRPWASSSASAASSMRSANAQKHISSSLASYRDACIMTEPEHSKTSLLGGRLPRAAAAMGASSKNSYSMTTQFQDAETQTWATTGSATFLSLDSGHRRGSQDSSSGYGSSRIGRASGALTTGYQGAMSKTVATSTEDLDREREHAQGLLKKQHRKLRATASSSTTGAMASNMGYYSSTGARDHHQSKRLSAYFSDEEDDSLTREMRKTKIKDEIARRRQNMAPVGQAGFMADLGASSLGLPTYYASDYSSHVPHYGSLPRMDFPSRHPFGGPAGDGALMRGAAGTGLDTYSMHAPYLPPPRRAVSLSGDVDYWRGYNQVAPPICRGLNEAEYFSDFGDYMSGSARGDTSGYYTDHRPLHSSAAGALRQISSSAPYLNLLSDQPNYRPVAGAGLIGGGDSGLLSHYASYLNREFANSSTALTAGPTESYNQPWRRTVIPEAPLPVEAAYGQQQLPNQNQSMWPSAARYTSDRGMHTYDSPFGAASSAPWRSSLPMTSSYRSTFHNQPQTQQHQTFSAALRPPAMNAPADPSLQYPFTNIPDRSWMRNAYRPAYQHPYPPTAGPASLQSTRSLDALRNGFGLTGTSRPYGDTMLHRTPYWSPLEISAGSGHLAGEMASTGSYPTANMMGSGFGAPIRYDSGYSSGGAGAGYASDSYHSNMGGLADRQSTLGRSFSNRPMWSSTEVRPAVNAMNGYISDNTIERRRFQTISGTASSDYDTIRSTRLDTYKHPQNGSRVKRVLLTKMGKEKLSNGSGLGMKIVGGKIIPGTDGDLGAFVASIHKGGLVDTLGEVKEGDQILEWNGAPLSGKTYEEVQRVIENSYGEVEIVLRSFDNNNNNKFHKSNELRREDSENDYGAMNGHAKINAGAIDGVINGNQSSYLFKLAGCYTEPMTDGKASPCFSTTPRSRSPLPQGASFVTGLLRIRVRFDRGSGTLFVHVLSARDLRPRSITASTARSGYPNPFVKVYLLPGRIPEHKRRTKFVSNTCNPEWDQTVVYKDLRLEDLSGKYVEFTVWDYDRFMENQFLGRVVLPLAAGSRGIPSQCGIGISEKYAPITMLNRGIVGSTSLCQPLPRKNNSYERKITSKDDGNNN